MHLNALGLLLLLFNCATVAPWVVALFCSINAMSPNKVRVVFVSVVGSWSWLILADAGPVFLLWAWIIDFPGEVGRMGFFLGGTVGWYRNLAPNVCDSIEAPFRRTTTPLPLPLVVVVVLLTVVVDPAVVWFIRVGTL